MKKFVNAPSGYALETIEGLCLAFPQYYRQNAGAARVVQRPDAGSAGKVGVVSGGGSGHLPVFTGYVGAGLLDACAVGDVFASPSAGEMAAAIKAANGGSGVLRLYGNYGGDVMNFDMAGELAEMDGIESTTVVVNDDVASASAEERAKRRGVAGLVYAFKIAGAAAEQRSDLAAVTAAAQKAVDATRTIGVALTPCIVPAAGKPTFTLGEDEMELGMGIHGEPGVKRGKLESADAVADAMLDRILGDVDLGSGERVSVLVNSLGATPIEELLILYKRVVSRLRDKNVTIAHPLIGRYATSMEMTGASLSIMRLDGELETLLNAPAECAFWKV